MRTAVFVENNVIVNHIVLDEGFKGDEAVELLGCIETTGMNPLPQIGWHRSEDGTFFRVFTPEEIESERAAQELIAKRISAVAKLVSLGLTEEEAKAIFL